MNARNQRALEAFLTWFANLTPDELFPRADLEQWALANGFVQFELPEGDFLAFDNSAIPQLWAWSGDRDESAEPVRHISTAKDAVAEIERLRAENERLMLACETAIEQAEDEGHHRYRGTDDPKPFFQTLREALFNPAEGAKEDR